MISTEYKPADSDSNISFVILLGTVAKLFQIWARKAVTYDLKSNILTMLSLLLCSFCWKP